MATPDRIEYRGPAGWRIVTDEDGASIRTPKGDALEQIEAEQLFTLFHDAVAHRRAGSAPIPEPPSRDELREHMAMDREAVALARATRALRNEFEDTPF